MPKRYSKARPWRNWYSLKRWAILRRSQLAASPLCVMCKAANKTKAAEVVDHIKPHRGDAALFWDPANLQSLCKRHHDSDKKIAENGGRAPVTIGPDGYPITAA